MPFIFAKKVKDDLMRENFSEFDFLELDTWVNFYFKQGRFPGNNDLTILPQTDLPPVVDQLSVEISPVDLYKKFGQGDTKCLTGDSCVIFKLWWGFKNCKKSNGRMEK